MLLDLIIDSNHHLINKIKTGRLLNQHLIQIGYLPQQEEHTAITPYALLTDLGSNDFYNLLQTA